ncbi:MAG TPA: hypothetical protein VG456_02790 [Candidatus Sulfopaludibacter sp.]|jgi:hypothetical protein|nr:hypothetical protein [Candidatus Sulfopaludibacter sp.]
MLAALLLSCFSLPSFSHTLPPGPAAFIAACAPDSPGGGDGDPVRAVPIAPSRSPGAGSAIQWGRLSSDSIRFLAIMHGFRWATEAGTRAGGFGYGSGYQRSVENLHGWADGDPFYVNYVGHPMQGAVAGRLFLLNDRRYGATEFGSGSDYWKGKLRAAAFAWAFSEQFEIGPLSEASIGHIQKDFPQQGFVDHVITPSVGLGWMIAEDALDRYVVLPVENATTNKYVRLLVRAGLNPARTFANVVDGKAPWYRASRAGVLAYRAAPARTFSADRAAPPEPLKPAPFEFTVAPDFRQFGGGSCVGGGAEAAYRVAAELQMVLDVNGCKLTGLQKNLSGDALFYQVGPRWTPLPTSKWSPYAHVLFGGVKITHETMYPDKKTIVEAANKNLDPSLAYTLHDQYTSREETSGVAFTAGTGVDYKLNDALAIRVANIEYLHTSAASLGGLSYSSGLRVTTGLVLRLGTW